MKGLLADLKHAARLYRGTPGASAIAIIVVAVAMAFVGAFLSLYVDLALRSHPGLSDSNRLVTIGQSDGKTFEGLPFSLIERMSGEVTSLDNAVGVLTITLDEQDVSEPTSVELVTQEFMRGLRPQLHLGRGFEPAEHDSEGEPVAIVSYRYWQEELGGREEALGQTIEIELRPMIFTIGPDGPRESEDDTRDFRIVGVMDRPMTGVMGNDVSIWLPFERTGALIARVPNPANFIAQMAMSAAIGRRSESATTESVLTEMQDLYADTPAENGLRNGLRLDAMGGLVRDINVQRDSERQLQLFLAASLLLAFVAAANVSLFLLARAPGRRRELGIRMSVGAPMKRLARQLATESSVLIVAAALGGLLISVWLTTFIRGLAFLRRAEWQNVTLLDWRVLSFVGAFLLVLTVLVSLAPILGLKRLGIATSSRCACDTRPASCRNGTDIDCRRPRGRSHRVRLVPRIPDFRPPGLRNGQPVRRPVLVELDRRFSGVQATNGVSGDRASATSGSNRGDSGCHGRGFRQARSRNGQYWIHGDSGPQRSDAPHARGCRPD